MATFRVYQSDGSSEAYDGRYKVTEGGVLTVTRDDKPPVLYSPTGWLRLEDDEVPDPRAFVI